MAVPRINEVARDFVTDGVPSSGYHEIRKVDLRLWGGFVETMINAGGLGGATWKGTKSLLTGDLAHADNSVAVVYDDATSANNGLYVKAGASGTGSWSQITTFLPGYQFITATDDGGSTVNAYTMDASPRLPFGDGVALVEFVVPATNTSSEVTISFDGGAPLTIKTASGNPPAIGGLIAGMPISGVKIGSTFFMRSDQASAAVLAQMEAALADALEEADLLVDSAVAQFTADTQSLRDQTQAASTAAAGSATEASMYAEMVGAAVYDFSFDSDPELPGYDWSE